VNSSSTLNLPTGTEIHYYALCRRKLWWFTHGIEQEHVDGNQGAENVALGQLRKRQIAPTFSYQAS